MNEKQTLAIRKLQTAFGQCKKAGLVFVGCDDMLVCVPSGIIERVWAEKDEEHHVHGVGDIANCDEAVHINTKGTYIDSGGV